MGSLMCFCGCYVCIYASYLYFVRVVRFSVYICPIRCVFLYLYTQEVVFTCVVLSLCAARVGCPMCLVACVRLSCGCSGVALCIGVLLGCVITAGCQVTFLKSSVH